MTEVGTRDISPLADLIAVIVIGAVTGFIVSKAVAPLLPKPRPQPSSNKQ